MTERRGTDPLIINSLDALRRGQEKLSEEIDNLGSELRQVLASHITVSHESIENRLSSHSAYINRMIGAVAIVSFFLGLIGVERFLWK